MESVAELHCTACDAVVPAGACHCPGCGLQLTASAAPAVYVEKAVWPFWPTIFLGLVLFFLIAAALSH